MATYDADLIEIDIEEIFFAGMEFEKPVMRISVSDGNLFDISDDVFEIESFTSGGIVQPIVYGVGQMVEFDVEEMIEPAGMNGERPVLWNAVSAGGMAEIKIGSLPVLPGDTMALIDFGELIRRVRFTDATKGGPLTHDLDFGDGSPHAEALPITHEYDLYEVGEPFTVDATLSVTGSKGQTDSITKTIPLLEVIT